MISPCKSYHDKLGVEIVWQKVFEGEERSFRDSLDDYVDLEKLNE